MPTSHRLPSHLTLCAAALLTLSACREPSVVGAGSGESARLQHAPTPTLRPDGEPPTAQVTAPAPVHPVPPALSPPADLDPRTQGWLFDKGRRPIRTGWEDQPERLRAAYCQGCHPQSHADWSNDIHARAWTDPLFTEALRKETKLWCVHCHAPLSAQRAAYDRLTSPPYVLSEAPPKADPASPDAPDTSDTSDAYGAYAAAVAADPQRQADQALLDEGVNCVACHVRNGQILGPRPSPNPAHPVTPTDYLSSAQFCAECHQFNFPKHSRGRVEYSAEPMQNTYIEWLHADPGATCLGCHADAARPHRTYGPHDPDWMRDRFPPPTLTWGDDPQTLHVTLQIPARGHRVPSGDLFHSLALEASPSPTFDAPSTLQVWRRRYQPSTDPLPTTGARRLLTEDTTLSPEAQRLSLTLTLPPTLSAGPLSLRLVYRYHDEAIGGRHPLPFDQKNLILWQAQAR